MEYRFVGVRTGRDERVSISGPSEQACKMARAGVVARAELWGEDVRLEEEGPDGFLPVDPETTMVAFRLTGAALAALDAAAQKAGKTRSDILRESIAAIVHPFEKPVTAAEPGG